MLFISSKDNPRIKQLIKLQKSARFRRQSGLFIAEGLRVCSDAMRSGAVIRTLYVTEQAAEKFSSQYEELCAYAEETVMLTDHIFATVSDTQTPQGFLCTIKTLDKTIQFDTIKDSGKFLALDNVQDPNKVVRGSMGAVYRVPFVICGTIAAFLGEHPELHSYAAVVSSDAERISDIVFDAPCVAVIGNEGNGLGRETIDACGHRITIPMKGNAESLNASAAATIIIWEMLR